jgi:hypothetical protein
VFRARSIHRLNTQHPDVRFAVGNQHLLAHAHVLDTCVDRAILSFLEGFNQNVAPCGARKLDAAS